MGMGMGLKLMGMGWNGKAESHSRTSLVHAHFFQVSLVITCCITLFNVDCEIIE